MSDVDRLRTALIAGAWGGSATGMAAVELLAWHKGWLLRGDFTGCCVTWSGSTARINWAKAREFSDKVTAGGLNAPRASTSEAAVLDFAVALGEDRFRLGNMGAAHRKEMTAAFATACGLGRRE